MTHHIYRPDLEDSPAFRVALAALFELERAGFEPLSYWWDERGGYGEAVAVNGVDRVRVYPEHEGPHCELCGARDGEHGASLEWAYSGAVDPDTGYREADMLVCAGGCRAAMAQRPPSPLVADDELPF